MEDAKLSQKAKTVGQGVMYAGGAAVGASIGFTMGTSKAINDGIDKSETLQSAKVKTVEVAQLTYDKSTALASAASQKGSAIASYAAGFYRGFFGKTLDTDQHRQEEVQDEMEYESNKTQDLLEKLSAVR